MYEHGMYIFGGKDDDNNKLNDLWKLDLQELKWIELKSADGSEPMERSGHRCDIYANYMVLFGGIYEITKELNDFYLYDFKENKWITLFEESMSPKKVPDLSTHEDNSPYHESRMQKKSGSPGMKSSMLNRKSRLSPPK